MPKKKLDPKAKAKRQKIIAGVGGVILVAVLAFQVPKTLKMMNGSQNAQTTTSTSTTPTPTTPGAPLAPPSLGGSAPSAAASTGASSSDLPQTAAPPATAGQLVSFNHFATKDPFAQQIDAACLTAPADSSGSAASSSGAASSGSSGSASCPSGGSSSASAPKASTSVTKVPAVSSPATSGGAVVGSAGSTTGVTPAPVSRSPRTTATISVNGTTELVKVSASFPQLQPIFRLVSLTATSAKISVVNGSLEGNSATVTLTKGKTLTLMNTADGTRYALRLLAAS
jgi:hypothetical protein